MVVVSEGESDDEEVSVQPELSNATVSENEKSAVGEVNVNLKPLLTQCHLTLRSRNLKSSLLLLMQLHLLQCQPVFRILKRTLKLNVWHLTLNYPKHGAILLHPWI